MTILILRAADAMSPAANLYLLVASAFLYVAGVVGGFLFSRSQEHSMVVFKL